MTNKQDISLQRRSVISEILGWFFGVIFFAIGVLNTFWGNDTGYGIFIILLSLVFFPPVTTWVKNRFRFTIPALAKIILALFIIWSALGVAELFDKIHLMKQDLG